MSGSIVLLTDRPAEGRRLQRDLGLISRCRMAAPHKPMPAETPAAIVTDIALDNTASVAMARAALNGMNRAATPVVVLMRHESRRADVQALALGAAVVLPSDASRDVLVSAVLRVMTSDGDDRRAAAARRGAREAGFVLASLMDAAEDRRPVPVERLLDGGRHVTRTLEKVGLHGWLDAVWSFDDVTYQHMLLVAGLAAAFSESLGFTPRDCRRVIEGALLHDIGKVGVPLEILNKAGPLTPDEMAIMRLHAPNGHAVLLAQGNVSPELLAIVRSHHEYLDGSGYPDGLAGDAIPDVVRFITVCDIFAALIESRPYRARMSSKEALAVMRDMGDKLDRGVLFAFERMVGALAL
ncbi:HD domain-containing phosphohydrolase [Methylopila sp. 73B]|uniref:HD-GYP domain-containing protein n=1 Tax=Methylopila sp. 73B TaxID=1120792 RepID=UPI00035F32C8|nr:HD domain-containing phosphohydrolase [Methylopila sp. 73B]